MKNTTSTMHSFYSSSPSYKVERRKNNRGIEFNYIESNPILLYMVIPLGIIFLLLLDDVSFWAIIIFLGVIAGVVFLQTIKNNESFVFDTQRNIFYRFNKKSKEKSDVTSFSKINAIQILHFIHTTTHTDSDDDGFDDSYTTETEAYEINLVLDNRRINIEANSDYKEIQKNARKISRLINVPIVEDGKS